MSLLVLKSATAGPLILIIIIAIVIGILRKIFQEKKSLITGERNCQHCGRTLSKLDVNFCRYCGTKLKTKLPKKKKTILGTIAKIIIVIFIILFFIGIFVGSMKDNKSSPQVEKVNMGRVKEIPKSAPIQIEHLPNYKPFAVEETIVEEIKRIR